MALKLLLWDIDGTLLNTDKAGMYAWLQALEEEHGAPIEVAGPSMAGMTDQLIARISIQEVLGREYSRSLVTSLLDRYVELLPGWLVRRANGFVLPGVEQILRVAHERDDVACALLTGNIRDGGHLKLAHYGLWDFFGWGAFGDVAELRRDIAAWARQHAVSRYGAEALEAIYVIGDTQHDIDCGKSIDARTIAVGTGPYSAVELERHEPCWAIDALPEPGEFFGRL